jgi:hypothetical protein
LNGGQCVIPGILTSGEYSVAAEQQFLNGRWCHILENPGKDRIWVDCGRGAAWMRREIYDQSTQTVIQRIDHLRHYEPAAGVWAPREMRNIHFDVHAARPELRNRNIINARIKILEMQLNDRVDTHLFDAKTWPPGALQVLAGGEYRQLIPGGYEHMDQFVEWAQRTQRLKPYEPEDSIGAARDYFAIAMAMATLAILNLARRKRKDAPNITTD